MQEYKDFSGHIFLDGKCLDSDDGFKLVEDHIKSILKQLKDHNLDIYSISMDLKFVDKSTEEYMEYVEDIKLNPNAKEVMEFHKDANDLSRMFNFDDITDANYKKFLQFLEYKVYDNMDDEQFIEFSKKFMELYGNVSFLLDAVIEGFDPTDYMDLNQLLRINMISYRIRKVCGKYQLVHERRRIDVV